MAAVLSPEFWFGSPPCSVRSGWEWGWCVYSANREHIAPLLTFFGSLLTFVGIAVGAWIAFLRHLAQTNADRQRRITDSFAKAVEQLGSDKLQVRLGGIYTLERVSQESESDYWPIMETLTAFVRERSPWEYKETDPSEAEQCEAPLDADHRLPTDVQAVLTVIKRREVESRKVELANLWSLDLTSTDLRGANLGGAHLEQANLTGARLERANLYRAHLEGANLTGARLERANLGVAHLKGALLTRAHLKGAILIRADLKDVSLDKADLEGADLTYADLKEAYLAEANLRSVSLGGADLKGASLSRVDLKYAFLSGADLTTTKGLEQDQLNNAFGDAKTKLPEGLTRPAQWLKGYVNEAEE